MKKLIAIIIVITAIVLILGHVGTAVQSELNASANRVSGYMAADQ